LRSEIPVRDVTWVSTPVDGEREVEVLMRAHGQPVRGRVVAPDRVPPLSNPFPAIEPRKPITTQELNAVNPVVFGHAFSNETPHMYTWQLSYARQITNTLMAELAYVGSKGENLLWAGNINEVQPGPGSQASRRLIQPLSNVTTILYFDTNNKSSYHSLQLKLDKRFSNGLQFLSAYTFGKSLDYSGSPASGGGAVGGPQSVTLDQSQGPRASTSSTASC
jgi:hypothetical protein